MPNESTTIELTINIKGRAEPIRVSVPPNITPNELLTKLQSQDQMPQLSGRHVAITHGTSNLQLDVALDHQNVKNGDALTVVWDGQLARLP